MESRDAGQDPRVLLSLTGLGAGRTDLPISRPRRSVRAAASLAARGSGNLCAVRNWASGLFACLLLASCGSYSGERTDGALDTTTSKAEQTEHAVIVHISNSTDPNIGLDMIENPLIDAIEAAGVGEFDGNEIGPDEALLSWRRPLLVVICTPVLPSCRE
jgi:hypothetical protein